MVDDDEFDGLGALTCADCGQAMVLLRARRAAVFACDDCDVRQEVGEGRPARTAAPRTRAIARRPPAGRPALAALLREIVLLPCLRPRHV